jgi:hypothetical protein
MLQLMGGWFRLKIRFSSPKQNFEMAGLIVGSWIGLGLVGGFHFTDGIYAVWIGLCLGAFPFPGLYSHANASVWVGVQFDLTLYVDGC